MLEKIKCWLGIHDTECVYHGYTPFSVFKCKRCGYTHVTHGLPY